MGRYGALLDLCLDPGNVTIDFDEHWIKLNGNYFDNMPDVSRQPVHEGDTFDLGAQKSSCYTCWRIQKQRCLFWIHCYQKSKRVSQVWLSKQIIPAAPSVQLAFSQLPQDVKCQCPFRKHKGINGQCLHITWVEGTEAIVFQREGCVKTSGGKEDSGRTTKLHGPSGLDGAQTKSRKEKW